MYSGAVKCSYATHSRRNTKTSSSYAAIWRHLAKRCSVTREHLKYDVRYRMFDTVDWIIKRFPNAPTEPIEGCPSRERLPARPIFVVGLPRSGTTLVERILGSHSEVHAAGELNHFRSGACGPRHWRRRAAALTCGQSSWPRHRELDFSALGAEYLERTRPATSQRSHFTDKMPLNYLYCGLIRRALPNAADSACDSPPDGLLLRYVQDSVQRMDTAFSYDLDDPRRNTTLATGASWITGGKHAGRYLRHQLRATGPGSREREPAPARGLWARMAARVPRVPTTSNHNRNHDGERDHRCAAPFMTRRSPVVSVRKAARGFARPASGCGHQVPLS